MDTAELLKIVEEQKRQLEAGQKLYDVLLEMLPGGLASYEVDMHTGKTKAVELAVSVAEMLGYEREELFAILRENAMALIHKEDLPEVNRQLQEVLAGDVDMFDYNYRARNKAGRYQWIRLRAKIVEQGTDKCLLSSIMNDIDVIKQSEQAARIENEKFKIALEHSKGYIWDYNIEEAEPAPARVGFRVAEESLEEWAQMHREVREGQPKTVHRLCIYSPEMVMGWYDCRYTAILSNEGTTIGAVGFAEDVTAAVEREQCLRDELAELQEICTFTLEREYKDIVLVDVPGNRGWTYSQGGKLAERAYITDYSTALEGRLRFVHPEDAVRSRKICEVGHILENIEASGGELSFSFRLNVDGTYRWMEYKAIYFNKAKKMLLTITRDIQDEMLKEVNAKLKLEEALEKAEKAANAKQEFFSHMSHEIRTPLNGIKGIIDILRERPELANDKYLGDAAASTTHLMSIVNNILDMSKFTSGKLILQKNWIARSNLINQVLAIAEPMAKEKEITLTYNSQSDDDKTAVYIDIARTKQVFWNLLSNAIKYTPPGGKVEYITVVTAIGDGMGHSVTHIRDTGIGMSPEFLQMAFEPFAQEERDRTQVGTGLGLAITKQLVEAMGGSIRMTSEVGKGTDAVLEFVVPMREYTGLDEKASSLAAGSITNYRDFNFKGLRCLMAEDNDINREIAKVQLESVGLLVDAVADGKEAVDRFAESQEGYYDILFMDIMMPVKDGLTASREIRALSRKDAGRIPIVAMTANAFMEDVHRSLENGMNHHLSKPFEKIQILEILAEEFACRK